MLFLGDILWVRVNDSIFKILLATGGLTCVCLSE